MKRPLIKLFLVLLFSVAAATQQEISAQRSPRSDAPAQLPETTAIVSIPLEAPGIVTLADGGVGSLAAGTYKIGVVAVNAEGGESQFDPLGYAANNSITVGARRKIVVSWDGVSGAATYHVYVWGPTGSYYQRYYETPSPSLTISTDPVGPVPVPIKLTASDTGGRLKAGNYYFAVSAEFADGGSVDQTNYANFPVATIRRDTGSVAVSWTALSGATAYRVYVVSEQDGSPRTHTKYFITPSNSATVTGTETYVRGAKASQMHGDGEVESSAVGIFGSIRTISNSKSFFQGDVQIAATKNADASFQANRFSNVAFAGLSVREAAQEYWKMGMEGASHDFILGGPGAWRLSVDAASGLFHVNGTIQPEGQIQLSTGRTIRWLSNDVGAVRIYTFSDTYGIGTSKGGDLSLFSGGAGGITLTHGGVNAAPQVKIDSNGSVGIGTSSPTSKLHVVGLPVFKNNAAAIAGGLTVGAFYRTGGDPDLVAVVH